MLVIPVLIIVLTALGYVRELHLARAQTRLAARECAFQLGMQGCEGASPPSCSIAAESMYGGSGIDIAATAASSGGGSMDPFLEFPLLGEAFRTLLGDSVRAAASAHVPFPFDGTRVGIASSEMVVSCNAVRRDVLDMAVEWLKKVLL